MSSNGEITKGDLFAEGLQVTPWGKAVFQSLRYALRWENARSEGLSDVVVNECNRVDKLAGKSGFRHGAFYVHDCTGSTGSMAWLSQDDGPKRDLPFTEMEANILRRQFETFLTRWTFQSEVRPKCMTDDDFEIDDSNESLVHLAIGTAVIGLTASYLEYDDLSSFLEDVSYNASARGKNLEDGDVLVFRGMLLKEEYPEIGKPHTCIWQDATFIVKLIKDKHGTPIGAQPTLELGPEMSAELGKDVSLGDYREVEKIKLSEPFFDPDDTYDVGYRNDQMEFSL